MYKLVKYKIKLVYKIAPDNPSCFWAKILLDQ